MAIEPVARQDTRGFMLEEFAPPHAQSIATWVTGAEDLMWLAPRTFPPLDAAKVCGWAAPGHQCFTMTHAIRPEPVGYGEINVLNMRRREYWLGHLVIAPAARGRGLGTILTRLLLGRAFVNCGARRVTLVVFPENKAAIRAYQAAGFRSDGYELHHFPPYQRAVELLRMEARR
jgi:RimJ/RimL family protein N-acetyltransferase